MSRRKYVLERNYDNPFGNRSHFHAFYDDPLGIVYPNDITIEEDKYQYKVIKCSSGVEVFREHEKFEVPQDKQKNIYIFIETEEIGKSNFFGTACRVKMGVERKELMNKLINAQVNISINDNTYLSKNLKQWAEQIAKINGIDAKALESAVRLELLGQNEFNQVLNNIFRLNEKLADWMKSGIEAMENWKLQPENYDYETYYLIPIYNNLQTSYGVVGLPQQEVNYKPIIPINIPNSQYKDINGGDSIVAKGLNKLMTLSDRLDEIAFALVYNTVKATPNITDDVFFAVIYYLKNYFEEHVLGEFKLLFKGLKELINQAVDFLKSIASKINHLVTEKLAEINAFLCGLINGIISLLQTVIFILAFIVDNIPFLELENLKPDVLSKHQEKLEFVEDLVDLLKENFTKLFAGIVSFFLDTKLLYEFSKFVTELWLKVKGLNKYFWYFFVGGVLFEVILDIVLAYFTGGSSAMIKLSAKISRMTTKADELINQGAKITKNISKKVADSTSQLMQWLKQELEELIDAFKNGNFINWLKKKFYEIIGDKDGLRKLNLAKHLKKFDKSFFTHLDGEVGIFSREIKGKKWEYIGSGEGGHNPNKLGKTIRKRSGTRFDPDPPIDDLPFKADIDVLYNGYWSPKTQTSSMFPKNWSLERIQEEVAWVYENTVVKGVGFKREINSISDFEGFSTNGFIIKIQIMDNKIINAFPINF